jgi:hypothetical protein
VSADSNSGGDVRKLYCPSARPEPGGVVFAVRTGDPERAGVRYLDEPVPVTPDVLALADPVDPREIFRVGAPCAEASCVHFTGSSCSLISRIVSELPTAVDSLPPCRLRARCRWFQEQGGAACRRCPLVITLQTRPDDAMGRAALPNDST